jgi:hypothetical protein
MAWGTGLLITDAQRRQPDREPNQGWRRSNAWDGASLLSRLPWPPAAELPASTGPAQIGTAD